MVELWIPQTGRLDQSLTAKQDTQRIAIDRFRRYDVHNALSTWKTLFLDVDPLARHIHKWENGSIVDTLRWRDEYTLDRDERYQSEGIESKGFFSRGIRIIVSPEDLHLELTRRFGPEKLPAAIIWLDDQDDRRLRELGSSRHYTLDERIRCAIDNPYGAAKYEGERRIITNQALEEIERQYSRQHDINRVLFEGRSNTIR